MAKYFLRRLIQVIPTVVGVTIVIFVLIRVLPGDPAGLLFSGGTPLSQEQLNQIRHDMGLDQPILIQYLIYIEGALHGDLGRSYQTNSSVSDQILTAAPATIELALGALLIAVALGVTAGVLSAYKQYSFLDYGTIFGASIGMAAPVFWIGLVLMLIFAVQLGWLPVAGRLDTRTIYHPTTKFYVFEAILTGNLGLLEESLRHLILPSITLGLNGAALIARITRSCMLDVINQDYVVTARAKGLAERIILLRHSLRNALIPVVTVAGLQLGYLLSGAVLTETVFDWPGLGTLLVSRIFARDYPVVQGVALFVSVAFVLVNLSVDLIYAYLDPRVRYG